jgi:hypothetical protein
MYNHLLETVGSELLVLSRPPYSNGEQVNPLALAALGRGVEHRVLYQFPEWRSPTLAPFRATMDLYHAAGVLARTIADVPMTMVVADRQAVLISISEHEQADAAFPTTVLVEHPGFAAVQATGFERLWEKGLPVSATRSTR